MIDLYNDVWTTLKPIRDFSRYVYDFMSKFVMICLFIDIFHKYNYLWYTYYHWTRDHWYLSTFIVLMLSYMLYKKASTK